MWDPRFATVYLVASLFALVPVFFILFPYLRDWVRTTHGRRPLWVALAATLAGSALFAGAVAVDSTAGQALVIDAIMKSVGVLGLLVGLCLVVLRLAGREGVYRRRRG
jgi:predicted MFS family arabinose efflux permease